MRDDNALIQAFHHGDTRAFEKLYERYFPQVYAFVYVRTHHKATAEDIVSQTFLQSLEKIDSYDTAKGTFGAWIHRIARNLIVDHYRALRPSDDIQDAWDLSSDSDTERDAGIRLEVDKVQSLLTGLTAQQRDTVLLRVWNGYSFAEIAEILDTTEAAAKMMYKRTIEKLQDALLLLVLLLSSLTQ